MGADLSMNPPRNKIPLHERVLYIEDENKALRKELLKMAKKLRKKDKQIDALKDVIKMMDDQKSNPRLQKYTCGCTKSKR